MSGYRVKGYRVHSTPGGIAIEGPDEDRAYEDQRQRDIDDAAEAERALFAGKEAGRNGVAAGANPHHIMSVAYSAWERGRMDGMESKPVACHSCTHLYLGAVCPICKEERPAYTALKSRA